MLLEAQTWRKIAKVFYRESGIPPMERHSFFICPIIRELFRCNKISYELRRKMETNVMGDVRLFNPYDDHFAYPDTRMSINSEWFLDRADYCMLQSYIAESEEE